MVRRVQVYPVGISLADAAIVGVTQRMQKSSVIGPSATLSHANYPLFHPMAESQPVLPCLLRRLLQKGAFDEAVVLARRHARSDPTLRHPRLRSARSFAFESSTWPCDPFAY